MIGIADESLATVKGVIKHAVCTDAGKDQFRQIVQPADCQRCLAGFAIHGRQQTASGIKGCSRPFGPHQRPKSLLFLCLSNRSGLGNNTVGGVRLEQLLDFLKRFPFQCPNEGL